MKKEIILFCFFAIVAQIIFAQQPLLTTSLSRDSIMIGEQVEWTFKATVAKPQQVYFARIDSIGQGRIEVLQATGPDTLQDTKNNVTVKSKLLLTSFDAGIYTLPQVPLLIVGSNNQVDTLYFDAVTLKVNTVAVDTTTFQPFDIKPPVKYPYTFMEIVWPWGVIALGVLLLIALIIYLIIRLKKDKPIFGKAKPIEPPHVIALRELEKIKAEKLWQNNKIKLYYTRVTDVLRVYLEQRYAIQAPEQTSDEILQAMAQLPLPEYILPQLREFLSVSDLVKFAKYLPAMEENEKAIALIVQFVAETKEQTVDGEKQKELNDAAQ